MNDENTFQNVQSATTSLTPNPPKNFWNLIVLLVLLVLLIGLGIFSFIQLKTQKQLRVNVQTLVEDVERKNQENQRISSEAAELKEVLNTCEKKLKLLENPPHYVNYFPVRYRFGKSQELGQSFRLTTPKNVSGITLKGSFGIGKNVSLTLMELTNPLSLNTGKKLAYGVFTADSIVKEKAFDVLFSSPVVLAADKDYVFIVNAEDKLAQAGIAYAESDIDKTGNMYEYTSITGGNGEILSENHSWEPKNSYDVVYNLIDLTAVDK